MELAGGGVEFQAVRFIGPLTDELVEVTEVVLSAVNTAGMPANSIGAGRSLANELLRLSETVTVVALLAIIGVEPLAAAGTLANAILLTATLLPAPLVLVSSQAAAPWGLVIAFVAT